MKINSIFEVEEVKENQQGSPLQEAQMLANLASYQKGSIVSREIIHKSTGTVTFFAFDEGQGLSEHIAPFDALIYIVEGKADVTISGKTISMKEGETVILPANQPHALSALNKFKMLLVMIRS